MINETLMTEAENTTDAPASETTDPSATGVGEGGQQQPAEGSGAPGEAAEGDASGARIPLTDATRDAMVGLPRLALLFK